MAGPDIEVERRRAARFLVVVLAILAAASFLLLKPIFSGATFALVVGFLLQEPYHKLARKTGYPHVVAFLFVVGLCIAVDIPLFLLGWQLLAEARGFAATIQSADFLPSIAKTLTRFGVPDASADSFVRQMAAEAAAWVHNATLPTVAFVGTLLMNTGVFLFVLYYTLTMGDKFVQWIHDALPLPRQHARHMIDAVAARMKNLFLGTFLVATCLGVLSGVIWWLLGFPDPVFWGAVMTVLNLIPALGLGVVVFPASAIAIATGRVWQGAALLGWTLLLAPIVGNVIRAAFVGKTHGVHPVLVLVGTVGGLAMFGPAGFLLGPLILSMIEPVLSEWQEIAAQRNERDFAH